MQTVSGTHTLREVAEAQQQAFWSAGNTTEQVLHANACSQAEQPISAEQNTETEAAACAVSMSSVSELESQASVAMHALVLRQSKDHAQLGSDVSIVAENMPGLDVIRQRPCTITSAVAIVSAESPARRTFSANVTTTRPVTPASPSV